MPDRTRSALVTGGTSGIGLEIARELAAAGHRVTVTGRTPPTQALGQGIDYLRVDHAASDAGEALRRAAAGWGAPLGVLVNNVGRRDNDPLDQVDPGRLADTLWLNVGAMVLTTSVLLPYFADTGGAILNVSSRLAQAGVPGTGVYAATKGAVNAFTRAAAVELAPRGIRVNAVAPGMTRTPLIDAWFREQPSPDGAERAVLDRIPLGRLGSAREVGQVAAFLCSDAAAYITGAVIPVDGGYTAA